ncbi:MAG: hypothetical protein KBS99_03710 [Prevotellaceae bacterium]|nr:hypothetical protein [Candidatus Colivivens caballi]
MKKLLSKTVCMRMVTVVIALFVSAIAMASSLTLKVEHEGDLYDMLDTLGIDKDAVTELILTGSIDESDLETALDEFPSLKSLDARDTRLSSMFLMVQSATIEKIVFPATVSSMTMYLMTTSLKDIYMYSVLPPSGTIMSFYGEAPTVHVPKYNIQGYRDSDTWGSSRLVAIDGDVKDFFIFSEFTMRESEGLSAETSVSLIYNDDYTVEEPVTCLTVDAPSAIHVGSYSQIFDANTYNHNKKQVPSLIAKSEMTADNISIKYEAQLYGWDFIALPFDFCVADIETNKNVDLYICRYSGENRATKVRDTWVRVTDEEIIPAYEGFAVFAMPKNFYDSDDPVLTFHASSSQSNNIFLNSDKTLPINKYPSKRSNNSGWNLVGNPYPCYFNIDNIAENNKIYVWDDEGKYTKYVPSMNELYMRPMQAFFVQAYDGMETVSFDKNGRSATDFSMGDDDDYSFSKSDNILTQAMKAQAEKRKEIAKGGLMDIDPMSLLLDPGANSFDPATGELYMDLFHPGSLLTSMSYALDNEDIDDEQVFELIKKLVIAAPVNNEDVTMLHGFTGCVTLDMSQSGGITSLPQYMFAGMSKLEEIMLPSCITSIGASSFIGVTKLNLLTVLAETPPTLDAADLKILQGLTDLVVLVPANSVEAYSQAWAGLNIQPIKGVSPIINPDHEDEPMLAINVSGRILNEAHLPLPSASVIVSQSYGREHISTTVNVDNSGCFSFQMNALPSILSFASAGMLQQFREVDETTDIDLGDICLERISGSMLEMAYTTHSSARPVGGIVPTWNDFDAEDIQVEVYNLTANKPENVRQYQRPYIVMENDIEFGSRLKITVTSRNNAFSPVETEIEATPDMKDGVIPVNVELNESARIYSTINVYDETAGFIGSLYDSEGNFVKQGLYTSRQYTFRYLKPGDYTLVMMQRNALLSNIQKIADYATAGLKAGTDYTIRHISVGTDGYLEFTDDVPWFDDLAYRHTTSSTLLTSETPSVTAGKYATMKVTLGFKPEIAQKVSNVAVVIDMPDDCSYLPSSLVSSMGEASVSVQGQQLRIASSPSAKFRFCITAIQGMDARFPGVVCYTMDGKEYQQPIGSAFVAFTDSEIGAPNISITPNVNVWGNAIPDCDISLYDNGTLFAHAKARHDGGWDAEATLVNAFPASLHQVYAEYENANGLKIRTAPASIFYNPDATVPTRVVMQNNGSNISFDLATGEISKPYYSFNPVFNEFTFKTTFAPNKPQDVFDVKFSIETNKGNQYLLRANYVDSLQCWEGKCEFDEYDLPTNVGVEYIDISSTPVNPIYAANATALMIVANHETYKSAFESKVTFDESSAHGNDKEASFNLNIDGFDSPFAMKVKELDYAAICAEMDVVQYTYLYNSGDTVVCINADSNEEMLTLRVVDSGLKVAYDITLSIDEAKAKAKTIAAGATVVGATNVFDKLNNFLLIPKYINAYQDYQSMKQMRDNNMQRIDDARNAFLNAIGARCKDGTPMLPDMWATSFYQYAMDLGEGDGKYYDDFENELDEYKTRVWKQAICDVASLIISNGINSFAIGGLVSKLAQGAIIPSLTKMLPRLGTAELVSKFLIENGVSTATNVAAEQVQNFFKTDFQAQKTHINDWSSSQLNEILKEYSNQTSRVKEHYQECPEDPLERPTSPFKKRHRPRDTRPIIDPSGYVYESGNEDKRIEGVTATLYFKAEESSEPTLWDAAEYGQTNPLVTDAEGAYSWYVPEGLWQVRFSKDGYADTQTEWLPVPPPQLEVNIPMTPLDGVLPGDANNDTFINVADITAIATYILGLPLEGFNKTNADVNGDSTIDVTDISATAGIILYYDAR